MTTEEIIVEVYNRLGYYVLGSSEEYPIGYIIPSGRVLGKKNTKIKFPFIIKEPATREEFFNCAKVIREIDPGFNEFIPPINYFFFKVEVAD